MPESRQRSDFNPIEHVFVLMLENHSFDQMLGAYQAIYSDLDGIDPAAPRRTNRDSDGVLYEQAPTTARSVNPDPLHDLAHVLQQIECEPFVPGQHTRMHRIRRALHALGHAVCSYLRPQTEDITTMSLKAPYEGAFVRDYAESFPETTVAQRREIMGYYERGALPALHALADHFTICDRWFASVPGPTWTNRFFVHTGTSRGIVRMPDHKWDVANYDLYDQPTIYDRLNERGKAWRIYYHDVAQSLALSRQWTRENGRRYRTMNDFEDDIANADEQFPAYVFVEPQYLDPNPNDDHPPYDIFAAQALIARIYNAIRANDALWKRTLLVILYDEHGGFYDHVCPPEAESPDEFANEFDFRRLGVRVPAMLVSPWAERGVWANKQHLDHTSLLRYLSDRWNLGSLGARVKLANSFAGAIRTTGSPREDTPQSIPSVPQAMMATQAAGPAESAQRNENQVALQRLAQLLESKMLRTAPQSRTMQISAAATDSEIAAAQIANFLDGLENS